MNVIDIDGHAHALTNTRLSTRICTSDKRFATFFEVQNHFVTHLLDYVYVGLNVRWGNVGGLEVNVVYVFRTDTQDDLLANMGAVRASLRCRDVDLNNARVHYQSLTLWLERCIEEVH